MKKRIIMIIVSPILYLFVFFGFIYGIFYEFIMETIKLFRGGND
jgi:hypothetical protein